MKKQYVILVALVVIIGCLIYFNSNLSHQSFSGESGQGYSFGYALNDFNLLIGMAIIFPITYFLIRQIKKA